MFKIIMVTLALLAASSCGVRNDSYLLDDEVQNNPLRIAFLEKANRQVSLSVAANVASEVTDAVYFCSGRECSDASLAWKKMSPIIGRIGFFSLEPTTVL